METIRQKRYRFVVLGLCVLVTFLNYLDRSVIAYAIKPIKTFFHIDNTQFGLTISAFALGTLAVNILAGVLVDRFSPRSIWTIGILLWSLFMVLLGNAQIFIVFLIFRFFLGTGEGINFPTLDRALLDWLPTNRISIAMAVALVGVPLANLVGSPLLANLITHFNWHHAFIILGVSGFILVVVWWACLVWYRFPQQPFKAIVDKESSEHKVSLKKILQLLKNPTILSISWSFFTFGYVLFFAISWLPGFLQQEYGLHLQSIGWFLMLPWGISAILILIGGFISDHLMKKTQSSRISRIHLIWICQLISVLCFIPVIVFHSLLIALIFISLAIGFALMPNAPYYSICSDISYQRAGTATGIMVSFFSLSGIVSPLVTGWLTDLVGNFSAALIALIIFVVTSIIALLIFAKPDTHKLQY